MAGKDNRANGLLFLACAVLSLGTGFFLTESSFAPSASNQEIAAEVVLADGGQEGELQAESQTQVFAQEEASLEETTEAPAEPTTQEAVVETAPPQEIPPGLESPYDPSPEAAKGVWVPQGSGWMFLVDQVPYTGWLNDTDGKRYYLDEDGYMHTGWLEVGDGRYYLDLDGIMQTGQLVLEGENYQFAATGELLSEEGKAEAPEAQETTEEAGQAPQTPETAEDVGQAPETAKAVEDAGQAPEAAADTGETQPAPETQEPTVPQEVDQETQAQKEPGSAGAIALTFDDGPSDFTDRILDCLEENKAHATFFLVGQEIENFPAPVSRMEELGCEIGNHTYAHTDLTTLSPEDMQISIGRTDQLILSLSGHGGTVLRPPYGAVNDSVEATVGTPMILWDVDTLDWETLDAQQTIQAVKDQAKDGSIILMHDIFDSSADAACQIIPWLLQEGYQLLTVHELAASRGVELQTGVLYGEF